MSLEGLNELTEDWTLNNSLTIKDAVIEGDLTTTGFIYGGGVTNNLLTLNNIWTGENTYTDFLPTYLNPTSNNEMSNKVYVDTTFNNIGNNFLPLNNTFSGNNTFNILPKINSNASSGNQSVNKTTADNAVNAYTGNLNTNNNWTGDNYFNTKAIDGLDMIVPNPTVDNHISNKGYVDNAILNFNSIGGKVELTEYGSAGNFNISCDPTIYSSMIVCMVSGGGYGNLNTTGTGQSILSYGGSGAMLVFKIPAYTGNALYQAVFNTRTTVGNSSFYNSAGTYLLGLNNGSNGSSSASGSGGNISYKDSSIGTDQFQIINGRTQARQNPITNASITRVNNIAVWNSFGNGGSFNFQFGLDQLPTNNYLLTIKFRN